MSDEEWDQHFARCLGVYLSGAGLTETDGRGRPLADDDFMLLFNAHHDAIPFALPALDQGAWRAVVDTGDEAGFVLPAHYSPGTQYPLPGRSVALLQHQRPRR
jgi:glycogen operon protein